MADIEKKATEEFHALIEAADEGQLGAVQKLREFLDAHPLIKKVGDVHTNVMAILMDKLTDSKASNHELLLAHIDEQKQSLGHSKASGLERMLIDRVVMCWLRLTIAEYNCNRIGDTVTTIKEAEYLEGSLTLANNRFIRAGEALERYRLMAEAVKIAKAKREMIEAKAAEARTANANSALRLLERATG